MELKNRASAFIWAFALVWLTLLIAFTAILVRDGPPAGYSLLTTSTILGVFWLGGLALGKFATSKACFYASVHSQDGLTLVWRYPLKTIRTNVPMNLVVAPVVVEGTDSEGDPYFFARLLLPDGATFDLAEGHIRVQCEAACEAFVTQCKRRERQQVTPNLSCQPTRSGLRPPHTAELAR